MFVSTTSKGLGEISNANPGPAYYNPALPFKKSFHYNLGRGWL